MCHNHSHLIVRPLDEVGVYHRRAATFLLVQSDILLQEPEPDGLKLRVPTSGQLFVPAWLVAGLLAKRQPLMGGAPMSLYLLPEGDMTTMQAALMDLTDFLPTSSAP